MSSCFFTRTCLVLTGNLKIVVNHVGKKATINHVSQYTTNKYHVLPVVINVHIVLQCPKVSYFLRSVAQFLICLIP